MWPSTLTRATNFPCASLRPKRVMFIVGLCVRFRVAVGEYDPHVAGTASSSARMVAAAASRLTALVADLRQVGASCGLGGAREAMHVANTRGRDAAAHAQSKAPQALIGTKLGAQRQSAVEAIDEAKCDTTRRCASSARVCARTACRRD
jgi:hypothetical protein